MGVNKRKKLSVLFTELRHHWFHVLDTVARFVLFIKKNHGWCCSRRDAMGQVHYIETRLMFSNSSARYWWYCWRCSHKDKDANSPSWGIVCIYKHGQLSVGEVKPTQSKTKVPRSKRLESGTTETQKISCALRLSCFIQKYQWQKAQDLLKLSKTGQTKQRTVQHGANLDYDSKEKWIWDNTVTRWLHCCIHKRKWKVIMQRIPTHSKAFETLSPPPNPPFPKTLILNWCDDKQARPRGSPHRIIVFMFSSMLQHEIQRIGFVLVFFDFVVWPKASRSHRKTFFFILIYTHKMYSSEACTVWVLCVRFVHFAHGRIVSDWSRGTIDTACSISLVAAETLYM